MDDVTDGFEAAFEATLGNEGGYQADPRDRGNWTSGVVGKGECRGTCYGISAAAYPHEDIAHLTLDRARALYRRDYWTPAGCPLVPLPIRAALFDAAVHHGPGAAVRMLQRAAGEVPDGIIGPRTLQAVGSIATTRLAARLFGERLDLMTTLASWPAFGRGWARRIAHGLRTV